MRSGDLVSYCAEEGVRILGEGRFQVSDSFPGTERTKYCLTSKVTLALNFPASCATESHLEWCHLINYLFVLKCKLYKVQRSLFSVSRNIQRIIDQ